MKCRICSNSEGNQTLKVREMMFGLREDFLYFQCANCGCLQIAEQPTDMSEYYSRDNYYSFRSKTKENGILKQYLKKTYVDLFYRGLVPQGNYINGFPFFKILKELKIRNRETNILDIGCGNGKLIRQLNYCGYKNLTGIDPFVDNEISIESLKIFKTDIFKFKPNKSFDLVMMNHSFEHIAEQHETLDAIRELMNSNGLLLIRIPLCDSFAFRKYRENWFQIDAPRHFFIHSVKSMQFLAENHRYILDHVIYDSTDLQFINSEKYCRNISLSQPMPMTKKRQKNLRMQAEVLNKIGDGDMACFVFRKTEYTKTNNV